MNTEKSLGAVLTETKAEIKEFIATRMQLFRSEVAEKLRTWKYSVPLMLLAAVILLAGCMTLTFALVAVIHVWFLPSPYSWFFAALIVTAIYLIVGGGVGWFTYTELVAAGVAPKRTLQVLKQDQVWLQNETRAA